MGFLFVDCQFLAVSMHGFPSVYYLYVARIKYQRQLIYKGKIFIYLTDKSPLQDWIAP